MTEAEVWDLFSQHGTVLGVALGADTTPLDAAQPAESQPAVCDVVVQMQSEWEAQAAMQQLNSRQMEGGHTLQVRLLT